MELTEQQHEENMIKRFPDYPCYGCLVKNHCTWKCTKWKKWAGSHWANISATGKLLLHKKEVVHRHSRVRVVADIRDVMQSELNEWLQQNDLNSNNFPAVREIQNGKLVERVIDRLLHGK